MKVVEETCLRRILERSKAKIEFATLFGSYKKGKNDEFSDVDFFIVCESESAKWKIGYELSNLRVNKEIHPTLITSHDFRNRFLNLDYLLVSILNDSVFLFGDRNRFIEVEQRISTDKPTEESIRYNQNMADKILGYANECFYRAQNNWRHTSASGYERYTRRDLLLMGIKNYHLALGYFLASNEMRKLDKAISLRRLIKTKPGAVMNDIISAEKRINREKSINFVSRNLYDSHVPQFDLPSCSAHQWDHISK